MLTAMPKRKSKRDGPNDSVVRKAEGEGEDLRGRSKTVMGLIKTKFRMTKSVSGVEGEEQLTRRQKSASLPSRVKSEEKRKAKMSPFDHESEKSSKTKTLHWMEEILSPYEESLKKSPAVTRKDSDESVDSGFEQTNKPEGSETDSNNSPAQSKALPLSPSLCHEASGSFQEEPSYHLVPSNSMYDKAAFDKAFGPMKDIGRWYSTYSSQQQLQQARVPFKERVRAESNDDEDRAPAVPVRYSSISALEDYEQRLVSRPLPPIPSESVAKTETETETGTDRGDRRVEICEHPRHFRPAVVPVAVGRIPVEKYLQHEEAEDETYQLVEHRLRGTNPLMLGLRNVARFGWYWGPVTRVEAEEKLQGADDGTFLVRDSSDNRYLLSLSFRSQGKTLHTRIEYSNGFFSFYSFPDSDSEGYRSIIELIEWSMKHSQAGVFCFSRGKAMGSPAVPVRLLKPLSRFNQVRSLQHYCRFVIRQSIRFDCIRQLPLPRHVHGFLEQSQY